MKHVYQKQNSTITRQAMIVIGCLGVALLLWWQQPRALFGPVASAFQFVARPFEIVVSGGAFWLRDITGTITHVQEIKKQNEALTRENLTLQAENARLIGLEGENEELRRNQALLPKEKYSFIVSEIIAKDPSGLGTRITISKGSEDGVTVGDAVVVEAGVLVGRVVGVLPYSADVELVTSKDSVVNVETLANQTRGIVRGEHGLNLVLDMVEQGQKVEAGGTVVTSGLSGEMPEGLLVGTIHDIRASDDRLFQKATIQSPVDILSLRFVAVLKKL